MTCLHCTENNPFNTTSGKCVPCPAGHIQVVHKMTGSTKHRFECEKCDNGFTPSRSEEACVLCHPSFAIETSQNGICECPESTHSVTNDICIKNDDLKRDRKGLFNLNYDNGVTIESSFLREKLLPAFYLCKVGKNESACQILANSCTMQLYSYAENGTACNLYDELLQQSAGDMESQRTLPKLNYEDHFLILQKPNFIPNEFTSNFEDPSSDVNITVAKYSVEGLFLGLSSLSDVIPCHQARRSLSMRDKFGVTKRAECKIRTRDFWRQFGREMEFLDTFLSTEESVNQTLYAIPIKIINLKRNKVKVNEATEKFNWLLFRRFFIADTIGGFDFGHDHIGSENFPKMVRYVEKINVGIQLQRQENPGRIFVPVITVYYNQLSSDDFVTNREISFNYEVEYYMDMGRSIEDIKISVGVMSSLAVIWAGFQTWSWNRRNGRAEIDLETILTLLLTSCGHIADAFFIVCLSTGLYWSLFFKKQVAVHVLLPQPLEEKLIRDFLISAFALKVVDMLKLIGRQVSVDIFFVDWEKPKVGNLIQAPRDNERKAQSARSERKTEKDEQSVSIWRSYFVANEWNEIQSMRKVHLPSQIIFSLLFLEVFGLKFLGLHWPSCSLSPGEEAKDVPYSTVARFTIATLVFGILGIIQWLYRVGIYERFFANKVQDFVDICTLANISVFILAAKQQGYYIHGRSVHGFADTDMQTMVEQMSREEEDLCGRRGLVATYDQQTFLISVPRSLRSVYDQVLQPLYASSKLGGMRRQANMVVGGTKSTATLTKPNSASLNMSAHAYHSLNRFLTSFLEHALSDIDYEVNDKSFFEATFDMEFSEAGAGDRAVFYNDNGHSFDTVLFYGNERTLFLFDLYLFIFVDILSHNFVLAGIVTFLVALILKCIRNSLGKRNIARKTLIDGRFLI